MTLGGMRWGWIEMEVEPIEVKSKWNEKWKEMPCKSSDCCAKGVVFLWMIVPAPRHKETWKEIESTSPRESLGLLTIALESEREGGALQQSL
jgi:hypothetical protein